MITAFAEQTPFEISGAVNFRQIARPQQQETILLHGSVRPAGTKQHVNFTAEFPESLSYDGIVVLVPGFGGIEQLSKVERNAHARLGRAAISYNAGHSASDIYESMFDPQAIHTDTIEAVLAGLTQHRDLRRIPNRNAIDFNRLLFSPHSMGGLAVNKYAREHTGRVEAVIHKASVGYGSPTIASLLHVNPMRLLRDAAQFIEPSILNVLRLSYSYGRNPMHTFGQGLSCLTDRSQETSQRLSEKGVKQAYLGFADDDIVPPYPVKRISRHCFNEFAILADCDHTAPQNKSDRVARAVGQLHAAMAA